MRSPNIPSPTFHQQNCRRGKGLWVKKGAAMQTVSFSSSRLVPSRHWDESTLPPSRGFWGVIWGHSPGNRGQKLLPLLLHQTGCTDDLVSRRPQVRPVHLLSQVFSHHLQIRLERSSKQLCRNHPKSQHRINSFFFFCRKIPAWVHRFPSLYFWAPGRIHKDKSTWGCGESWAVLGLRLQWRSCRVGLLPLFLRKEGWQKLENTSLFWKQLFS